MAASQYPYLWGFVNLWKYSSVANRGHLSRQNDSVIAIMSQTRHLPDIGSLSFLFQNQKNPPTDSGLPSNPSKKKKAADSGSEEQEAGEAPKAPPKRTKSKTKKKASTKQSAVKKKPPKKKKKPTGS